MRPASWTFLCRGISSYSHPTAIHAIPDPMLLSLLFPFLHENVSTRRPEVYFLLAQLFYLQEFLYSVDSVLL